MLHILEAKYKRDWNRKQLPKLKHNFDFILNEYSKNPINYAAIQKWISGGNWILLHFEKRVILPRKTHLMGWNALVLWLIKVCSKIKKMTVSLENIQNAFRKLFKLLATKFKSRQDQPYFSSLRVHKYRSSPSINFTIHTLYREMHACTHTLPHTSGYLTNILNIYVINLKHVTQNLHYNLPRLRG